VSEVAFLHNVGGEIPDPDFDLAEQVCWDGIAGSLILRPIVSASPGSVNSFTISAGANLIEASTGVITINEAGTFEICLSQTLSYDACATAIAGSCERSICQTITIVNDTALDPSWDAPGPFCEDDDLMIDLDDLVTGNPGGVFSGQGVTGTHPDYVFSPVSAGVGEHTICYNITTAGGCEAVECTTIVVHESVNAQLTDLALDCDVSSAGQISLSSLMTSATTTGGTFSLASTTTITEPWINEIGYDDPGTDDMEFIEVAGPAGFNLAGCNLVFYNGGNQMVYGTFALSGIIPNESAGVGALSFTLPFTIQNATEGVALECGGTLIEFITYEGTFIANGGIANGVTGTPTGTDAGTDGEFRTLQNMGSDSSGPWFSNQPQSPGLLNGAVGQNFGATSGGSSVVGGSVLSYSEPGCYEVDYSVSSFEGADGACIDFGNAFILIPEHPEPVFALQEAICLSEGDGPFVINSTLSSPTYVNSVIRTWSIGSSTLINATAIVDAAGQVTVSPTGGDVSGSFTVLLEESITNAACGSLGAVVCMNSFTATVNVQDGSALNASFTLSDDICPGDVVTLTASEAGGTFEGVGVVDNGDGTGTFTPPGPGDFSITYTLNSAGGCTNTFTQVVTVDQVAPVIMCPEDVVIECGPPPVLDDPTTGELIWDHNGPDFTHIFDRRYNIWLRSTVTR